MKFFGAMALLIAVSTSGFASPSSAVQQQKVFGVMDDNPVAAAAAQSGFTVIKRTVWISPTNNTWDNTGKGFVPVPQQYRDVITDSMTAASSAGMKVILELYLVPKFGPPRGPSQMRGTCDLAKDLLDQFPETYGIEVGVEPNSSTFWWPQFYPDGTQASAAAYERWLSICYDKIKGSHPGVLVLGGSLSSRGEDQPNKSDTDTSPVLWLQKFCSAYKGSGRTKPIMDWFDMHSYPDPEDQDPTVQHPYPSTTITIADSNKLSDLLGCFSGTAQLKPPVCWCEAGYNTEVPQAQAKRYIGVKPSSIRLVDEATQGRYVATQIQMAYCQPNSVGFINFHFVDDADRSRNWQSGFAYPAKSNKRRSSSTTINYTLKQSIPAVRQALAAVENGTMNCGSPGSP